MRAGTCLHFNGVQNLRCRADIPYESVRDDKRRLPCLTLSTAMQPSDTKCASYLEPTIEQIAAFNAELDARMDEIRARGERNECSECGAKIVEARQVGRCVYAEPCNHRIGQGSAVAINKRLRGRG